MANQGFVFFWGPQKENGYLSNWFPAKFEEQGVVYNSVEQYMMVQKALLFGDHAVAEKVMKAKTPKECKNLGRKVENFFLDLWYERRMDIVKQGNFLKFSQNPELLNELLATGNALLAEASPFDRIWGIGLNKNQAKHMNPEHWIGQNLLGKILMELRYWFYEQSQRREEIIEETESLHDSKRFRSVSA